MPRPRAIVPLWRPDDASELAPAAGAIQAATRGNLTYRGGGLLSAVRCVPIFWGAGWSRPEVAPLIPKLHDFLSFFLGTGGPMVRQLAEYAVPAYPIRAGSVSAPFALTRPAPRSSLTDYRIRGTLLRSILPISGMPQPDANALYILFLPPGTTVTQQGERSCQVFCGYHDALERSGQPSIYYAVCPWPACEGCRGGSDPFTALCRTLSHEVAESVCDPTPGQGWYDDAAGEISDICAWRDDTDGMWTWQQAWSNAAGRCI